VTEAYCDCTRSSPWAPMTRLHAGAPNRFYLCRECGAVREDVYQGGAIVEYQWHDASHGMLPNPVREEALDILDAPNGEQLAFW